MLLGVALALAGQAPPPTPAPAPQLEDVVQRLGPFHAGQQSFFVTLRLKRVQGGHSPDPVFDSTVVRLEIRDAAGTVQHQQTFPYELGRKDFDETVSVSVFQLEGRRGSGLLVEYGSSPSTPMGGVSWQVFGIFDGRLVPFSPAMGTEGELLQEPQDGVLHTAEIPQLDADALTFRVWTGNFFVVFPVRIDWLMAKARPAWQCLKMTAKGPQPRCRFGVEGERVPVESLTFIRLFPEPDEAFTPEHVVVKPDSAVELLEAEAEPDWEESIDSVGFGVKGDIWLKVRVDGKEGWIHTEEDLRAIGLPMAG